MVLSSVEEEIIGLNEEQDDEQGGGTVKTTRTREMMFVRGDGIVMVSPPLRTN